MRRYVMGDIHGHLEYLLEVLKASGFNYEEDLLIQLGDIVDRGEEPFKCMDELLKIKNLIRIKGNHDEAFVSKIVTGESLFGRYDNGQSITVDKWRHLTPDQKTLYFKEIFNKQVNYHLTEDNILFVHGGIIPTEKLEFIEKIEPHVFYWDRELWSTALLLGKDKKMDYDYYDFKDVFIGHTPTTYYNETKPMYAGGIWNVDTGAGKGGPLTIMDVDTKEYWQSKHEFKTEELWLPKEK